MTQSRQESPFDSAQLDTRETTKPKATIMQSVLTGSVAGAAEVLIDHPLWTIKTRLQRGEPFTLNPSLLYRGIVANTASMVPITAMQVGLNTCFQNLFYGDTKELSNSQRMVSAFVAGVGSSFVGCPTEMIMTHQGKAGGGFYTAAKDLAKQGGWRCLFTGLSATAMREGVFTAFFLAGMPMFKASIQPYCSNSDAASLMAGMGAGVGATIASQGVDTIKTIQQAANVSQPVGLSDAVKKLYSAHGVHGFFKGCIPRGARVMSAVTIMGWVNEQMEAKIIEENKALSSSARQNL